MRHTRDKLWPLAGLLLLLAGCVVEPVPDPPELTADTGDSGPTPLHLSDCTSAGSAPVQLLDATIDGDTLQVHVSYDGGCAPHDLALCWPDQAFQESEPVQARLELWHEDNDDPCDASVYDSQRFDLIPLAEAWREAYGPGPGTIIVNLGAASLAYTFR